MLTTVMIVIFPSFDNITERYWLAERLGSGDGERKTLLTRQIAFEPLPASVLFALVLTVDSLMCLFSSGKLNPVAVRWPADLS